MKKIIYILLSALLITGIASGCGKESIEPAEAGKIIYNVLIKGDYSEKDKIGLADDAISSYRSNFDEEFKSVLKAEFEGSSGGFAVTDEQAESVLSAIKEGLRATTFEVKEISREGDSATIEYSINGLDFGAISSGLSAELDQYTSANPDISDEEFLEKLFEIYSAKIKEAPLSAESSKVETKLKLQNNFWTFENENDIFKVFEAVIS